MVVVPPLLSGSLPLYNHLMVVLPPLLSGSLPLQHHLMVVVVLLLPPLRSQAMPNQQLARWFPKLQVEVEDL